MNGIELKARRNKVERDLDEGKSAETGQWRSSSENAQERLSGYPRTRKAGIALRPRPDGRRWIQSVKTRPGLHGGLSRVAQVEKPAPDARACLGAIPEFEGIRNCS